MTKYQSVIWTGLKQGMIKEILPIPSHITTIENNCFRQKKKKKKIWSHFYWYWVWEGHCKGHPWKALDAQLPLCPAHCLIPHFMTSKPKHESQEPWWVASLHPAQGSILLSGLERGFFHCRSICWGHCEGKEWKAEVPGWTSKPLTWTEEHNRLTVAKYRNKL